MKDHILRLEKLIKERENSAYNDGTPCNPWHADLTKVDFKTLIERDLELSEIRHLLGIDIDLLRCYYCTEKKLFKDVESQRLI